ncbi:hypothetical protein EVJ58_g5478 [Rhodofomes roseus]|uniref:DNA 3'-5' helicase n=1 Tax=Rhodofomes roseus TaxID=34475 RepID=A0A4Y9YDE0_9APHY|nr:hypothetical protein EVJ58_g5478 [Rhodofomes roseus]
MRGSAGQNAHTLRQNARRMQPRKTRRRLTAEEVEHLSTLMQDRFRWPDKPRFFQVEGVKAQIEGIDAIIQAPTGSGKTAIAAGPHLWPGNEGMTTIMVCPLLALEEEMVTTFKTEFGLTAVAINGQNGLSVNRRLMHEIVRGDYRVILISPEMLLSQAFKDRVLHNSGFARRVLSVVVDEAHCVSHWGADFRKHYGSLGTVRAHLPSGTPVIAVTATLTARVRRDLHNQLHIPKIGSKFVNVGNDRPNVSIVVRACEYPQYTYADLDFILPETINNADDIPKTYLYVDNIEEGNNILDHLGALLQKRNPHLYECGILRPFNATMSSQYRTHAMAAFRSNADYSQGDVIADGMNIGPIRVLVCTDAAGMGCNVPDVDRVVQWKLPKTFSNFIQRAGRAARGRGRKGIAILLVEQSAYSVDLQVPPLPSDVNEPVRRSKVVSERGRGKGKSRAARKKASSPKEYAVMHGVNRGASAGDADDPLNASDQPEVDMEAADEGLLTFVQSTQCRRRVWRHVYECPSEESASPATMVPCCDVCEPSLFDCARCPQSPNGNKLKKKARKQGLPDLAGQTALEQWRQKKLDDDHPDALFGPSAILSDTLIQRLTSVGPLTRPAFSSILETWLWRDRYEAELADLLAGMQIAFRAKPQKASTQTRGTKRITADAGPSEPGASSSKRPRRAVAPTTTSVTLPAAPVAAVDAPPRPSSSAASNAALHATARATYPHVPSPISSHGYSLPASPAPWPNTLHGPLPIASSSADWAAASRGPSPATSRGPLPSHGLSPVTSPAPSPAVSRGSLRAASPVTWGTPTHGPFPTTSRSPWPTVLHGPSPTVSYGLSHDSAAPHGFYPAPPYGLSPPTSHGPSHAASLATWATTSHSPWPITSRGPSPAAPSSLPTVSPASWASATRGPLPTVIHTPSPAASHGQWPAMPHSPSLNLNASPTWPTGSHGPSGATSHAGPSLAALHAVEPRGTPSRAPTRGNTDMFQLQLTTENFLEVNAARGRGRGRGRARGRARGRGETGSG